MRIRVDLMILVPLGISAVLGRCMELLTFWSVIFLHELAHVFMAHGLFKKPVALQIHPFRVSMTLMEETGKKETGLIALAGPLMNLAIALILFAAGHGKTLPALFHLGQGLLNLLPWLPLDGGQILEAYKDSLPRAFNFMTKWGVTLALAIIFFWALPRAFLSYLYMLFFLLLQFISQKRAQKKMRRTVADAKKLVDKELQSVVK